MNQQTKTTLENAWKCLNCRSTIIPFEKSSNTFAVEFILFAVGVIALCVNFIVGGVLIALSIGITIFNKSNSAKICPSCESPNIVPATSPAAKMKRA